VKLYLHSTMFLHGVYEDNFTLLYPYAEEICWGEEWMQLADDQAWLLGNVVIKLRVL